jgi:hypothetical protein
MVQEKDARPLMSRFRKLFRDSQSLRSKPVTGAERARAERELTDGLRDLGGGDDVDLEQAYSALVEACEHAQHAVTFRLAGLAESTRRTRQERRLLLDALDRALDPSAVETRSKIPPIRLSGPHLIMMPATRDALARAREAVDKDQLLASALRARSRGRPAQPWLPTVRKRLVDAGIDPDDAGWLLRRLNLLPERAGQ